MSKKTTDSCDTNYTRYKKYPLALVDWAYKRAQFEFVINFDKNVVTGCIFYLYPYVYSLPFLPSPGGLLGWCAVPSRHYPQNAYTALIALDYTAF